MEDLFTKTKVCNQCNQPRLLKDYSTYLSHGKWIYRNNCNYCCSKSAKRFRDGGVNKNKLYLKDSENGRRKRYGIQQSEFERMLHDQNFKCMICQKEIGQSAQVDHNHVTGEIRSLLCGGCNSLISNSRESIEILQAAILYLQGWS